MSDVHMVRNSESKEACGEVRVGVLFFVAWELTGIYI